MSGLTGVVASDLEGTLTTGETWKGVGRYLATHGRGLAYRTFFALHVPGVLLARAGIIPEQRLRNEWMRAMVKLLADLSIAEMAALSEWVVEHELWPKRRPEVLAELLRHRAAGRRVILASGTYLPVLQAFADRMDAEVLGTPLQFVAGKLTGHLAGPINAGEAKAEQLAVYLNGVKLTAAYGDTLPDVAMLEMSVEPVAVHPSPDLQRVAAARGWRVLAR